MFFCQISQTVELRILGERHTQEFFDLVQKNYDRLLHSCPWMDQVDSVEKTGVFIRSKLTKFASGDGFTAGFFEKGNLIGVIALEYIDHVNRTTEIGYWLDADAEGRGLVRAASRVLIDHAFTDLRLERIQIRCASENIRSRAIPEKLGFSQEGVIRRCERLHDRTVDLVIYGLLETEWRSKD